MKTPFKALVLLSALFTLIRCNPEYDARQSYQDAYRVTARFFVWLEKHVKPRVVVALDQSMRGGRYTPEFWTQQTGKNVDDLWQDYGKNPVL